jgi:hypothetical protein
MYFPSKAVLATATALIGLAHAGPKRPRADASTYNNVSSNSNSSAVALNIRTKTGQRNATAPLLYGWMFEDINHSGDGGLYGELLRNRAFEGSDIQWGAVAGYSDSSITWQENSCEALGMFFLLLQSSDRYGIVLTAPRPCPNWIYNGRWNHYPFG